MKGGEPMKKAKKLSKPARKGYCNCSLYADELSNGKCMLLFEGCYDFNFGDGLD